MPLNASLIFIYSKQKGGSPDGEFQNNAYECCRVH